MRTFIGLLSCLIAFAATTAQNIDFDSADPEPILLGALFGDLEFSDIDDDGDMDLFLCGREDGWTSSAKSTFYLNDGSGNFTEDTGVVIEALQSAAAGFKDLDGDGDDDLLVTGMKQGSLPFAGLYLSDGQGGFSLLANTPFEPCLSGDIAFGDVDGDGDEDVFLTGLDGAGGSPIAHLYLNGGAANFTEVDGTVFQASSDGSVELSDMDGDGDLDLLSMGADINGEALTSLYLNNGSAVYSLVTSGIADFNSGDFALGDLDNDGDKDVLISGQHGDGAIITEMYLNDGAGAFTLFSEGEFFPYLFVGKNDFADFDNDDDLDIIMTGSATGGLGGEVGIITKVYENQGANLFIEADSLTGSYFSSLGVGDINGDGLLDFIVSGTTVGTPTFKTWVYLNSTEIAPCPADFTNDGLVNVDDFLILNSFFGEPCSACPADMNADGEVNIEDFLLFNSAFGVPCD